MGKVAGKDVLALIFYNGQWRNYACGLSVEMDVTTDFLETSTKGNGKNKTFIPTTQEFTANLSGVVVLNDDTRLLLPNIRTIQEAQSEMLFKFSNIDVDGNDYTEEFKAYISKVRVSSSIEGASEYTVDLRGTGAITQIYTIKNKLNDNIMRLEYTGIGGENGFTNTLLIGKNIFAVFKDGVEHSRILLTGTPVNKDVLFNSITGGINFAVGVEIQAGEEIAVLYQ
jgi:hypothetical protein